MSNSACYAHAQFDGIEYIDLVDHVIEETQGTRLVDSVFVVTVVC